jgi:hypothetical protein
MQVWNAPVTTVVAKAVVFTATGDKESVLVPLPSWP